VSDLSTVRMLGPDDPDRELALHLALNVAPARGGGRAVVVADLLRRVWSGPQSIDMVFGAYLADRMTAACLVVESPGHSGMIFVTDPGRIPRPGVDEKGLVLALKALRAAAWERSLAILEVLIAPDAAGLSQVLDRSGFTYLTRLLYLQRQVDIAMPRLPVAEGLELITYEGGDTALFLSVLEESYAQSLDCPELVGLRRIEDAFEGHRATGDHDPRFWWVALRDGKPAGVLLLSRVTERTAMEVVYVGVAQVSRGQDVGNALMDLALRTCIQESAKVLALAVDCANTPARRMYERWGFVQTGARDAWIASPTGNEA